MVVAAFRTMLFAWLDRFSVRPLAEFEREIGELSQTHAFDAHIVGSHRGYAVRALLTRSA